MRPENLATRHSPLTTRRGFTLIELLVVLVLILLLAALAVGFVPRATERAKSTRGADQLQQWLLIAKQWAKKDRVPTGIRFQPNVKNGRYVTDLQYIQQPDDFVAQGDCTNWNGLPSLRRAKVVNSGGLTQVMLDRLPAALRYPNLPPGAPPPAGKLVPTDFSTDNGFKLVGGNYVQNNPELWAVQAGDYFQIKGGLPHIILGVNNNPNTGSPGGPDLIPGTNNPPLYEANVLILAPSALPDMTLTKEYRIIRGPRVVQGEAALQLPQDVAIDLNLVLPLIPSPTAAPLAPTAAPIDVLFSPAGNLLIPSSVSDKLILWVRDTTQDGLQGDQTLLVVQARTGFIAAHPVTTFPTTSATTSVGPTSNPNFVFTVQNPQGMTAGGYMVLDSGGANPEAQYVKQVSGNQITVGNALYNHTAPFTVIFDPYSFTRDGRSSGL